MSCQPIGLFDSGVGGLSVLCELKRQLPSENLIYFADTIHMPYGPRTPENLKRIVFGILRFLEEQKVKLVIMACNTSSAVVLPSAKEAFALPIIGMIEPVIEQVVRLQIERLGVMATEATVRSGTYERELRRAGFSGYVHCQPCPELASLIEDGEDEHRLATALQCYSSPLRKAQVEQVVLGCTHYPFAKEEIQAALGPDVLLLDPAIHVVAAAKRLLEQKQLLCQADAPGSSVAYVSGDLASFERRAKQLLGYTIDAQPVRYQENSGAYNL